MLSSRLGVTAIRLYLSESRGQAFNTSASYLGVPEFKSGPEDRISRLRFFVVLSLPPRKCRDRTLYYTTTASLHILSNSPFPYSSFI
jgi:hypothetical protein